MGISIDELLPDKPTEETQVSKNKTIDQQKKVITGFSVGCAIGLFVLALIFIEPLRDCLELLGTYVLFSLTDYFAVCYDNIII